jgi:hypothetical protein
VGIPNIHIILASRYMYQLGTFAFVLRHRGSNSRPSIFLRCSCLDWDGIPRQLLYLLIDWRSLHCRWQRKIDI